MLQITHIEPAEGIGPEGEETKRKAFLRLANKRLFNLLNEARKMDNLFKNRSAYEVKANDVDIVVSQLQEVIEHIQKYKQKIKQH